MENEREIIEIGSKNFKKKQNVSNSKINKIILLQILNLFFLSILVYYFKGDYNPILYREIQTNAEEKINFLKLLTNNDELEYKGIENCLLKNPDRHFCIYHLILPKEVIGKKRILLGEKADGAYVLLDDLTNIKIAYSFGISDYIQFDKALADKGIDIYMYDHTINSLPYENPKFHWKKIGICGLGNQHSNMKNLEELIIENGHINEKEMILKMDVEHWEWESLIDLKESTLNQFKYIAIEFHFRDEKVYNNHNIYYNVIKKLSQTHQAFYVRCNGERSKKVNFGFNRICHIMEVSYVIKKGNFFKKDEAIYPIYEFDYSKPELGKLEMNLNLLKVFEG